MLVHVCEQGLGTKLNQVPYRNSKPKEGQKEVNAKGTRQVVTISVPNKGIKRGRTGNISEPGSQPIPGAGRPPAFWCS